MAEFQAEHDFVNDYYHLYMDEKRLFTYNVLADEINCFLYYNIDDEIDFLKKLSVFNKVRGDHKLSEKNWS